MQSVQRAITPQKQDLVTTQEYDPFGCESTQWLPSVSKNNGAFVPTVSIPSNGWDTYQDSAYSRPVYEASPLNRVLEQYGPGKEWYANKKRITTDYLTNNSTDLSCILYTVSGTRQSPTLKNSGIYNPGELYVTKLTNEDGHTAYEFKNKLNQVVLTRQIEEGAALNTYYVYDDYGNQCFVLPPKVAGATNMAIDSETMQQYAYLYRYDNRNRCVEKKLPGADWIFYVYDQADRPIFSQGDEQREKGEGLFLIPDVFGRPVLSGITQLNVEAMRSKLENTVITAIYNAANTTNKGYDIKNLELTAPVILSVNYYDNYDFLSLEGFSKLGYQVNSDYGTMYTSNTGRLTGNITALLDTISSYLYTATYYDLKGQAIQSHRSNHLGGIESSFTAYNFVGQPTDILSIHTAQINGADFKTEEHLINQYDHAGRLTKTAHSLNGAGAVLLAQNTYNEQGRLQTTMANNEANTKVSYDYNIRSWTKTITNNHFIEDLEYTYSGNIDKQIWKQSNRTNQYIFAYDNLSRIKSATYTGTGRNYTTGYTYDWHGNVQTIQRNGKLDNGTYGLIDNMTFAYTGNQLKKITDSAPNLLSASSTDFKNGANADVEYQFNTNGAMIQDLNKGIKSISYNSLNLPRQMVIENQQAKGTNLYTYTATGQKLRVIHQSADTRQLVPMSGTTLTNSAENITTQKDYIGNKIYENGVLKQIQLGNGYIEGGKYYFYIKDHLGNNRIVANSSGGVEESNEYYPFGGLFAKNSNDADKQDFKYNGKEYDSMHGLNQYDYAARYYDPANIRFTTMDPMAEKYYSISPYVYVANNPMKFIDPTGMVIDDYYNENAQKLGSDDAKTSNLRTISQAKWDRIQEGAKTIDNKHLTTWALQRNSKLITTENAGDKFKSMWSESLAGGKGHEKEVGGNIVFNYEKATVTFEVYKGYGSKQTTSTGAYIPYKAGDKYDGKEGTVVLGNVHTHPTEHKSWAQGATYRDTFNSQYRFDYSDGNRASYWQGANYTISRDVVNYFSPRGISNSINGITTRIKLENNNYNLLKHALQQYSK